MSSRAVSALWAALLAACLAGCAAPQTAREDSPPPVEDPPAAPGATAPRLVTAASGLLLTWLEPADGDAAAKRLRFARWTDDGWSEPVTVAEGSSFFANWADFPSVAEDGQGTLLAHWLEKTGDATYAYGIQLARSDDGGATWRPLGFLHNDGTPTEHGFVSLVPQTEGFTAVWLDGRAMLEGGPMALRAAPVGERVGEAIVLDPRVCDCCGTAVVSTAAGVVAAFRDRSEDEIRDVSLVRRTAGGWSEPEPLHRDGWQIAACPVNGPALDAEDGGGRAVAAWYTVADGLPRVQAAFSGDGGGTFGPPAEITPGTPPGRQGTPLGRVDVVLDGASRPGAVVSWLASEKGRGVIYLRRVDLTGRMGEPYQVATTAEGRASGFPQLARRGDRLYVAWVETAGEGDAAQPSRIRLANIPIAELPAPPIAELPAPVTG